MRFRGILLAATTLLGVATPSLAGAQSTPAFRVPLGSAPTSSNVAATYAWLEQIGSCSTTCGIGTRTTGYQCQNIADYDYAGAGYGVPEADSMCTSTIGARPADVGSSCTVYSGCGYDWVKPPVVQKPIPLESNPTGRIDCGYVNQKFSPVCQRSGGSGGTITMAAGDHRFCSADRPDYNEVAAGDPDALGYDRNVVQTTACAPQDHDWTQSGFGSWSSDCDTNATRVQVVQCKRRFDGKTYGTAAEEDTRCGAGRPAASQTSARYGSCSFRYDYTAWSTWSSDCDTNATRTRTGTCIRSNNGGQTMTDAACTAAGVTKEGVSETTARYGSCTYVYKTATWSAYNSTCSASATRTRDVWCERSNNDRVADSECSAKGLAKPGGSESAPQYGGCTYSWEQGGFGAWSSGCANSATRTQAVRCKRDLDGATAADSSCNAGTRPAASQTSSQYGSCSYTPGGTVSGWSGWSSGCSSSATRTRQYQCVRSNDGGQIVPDGECLGRQVNLTESQTGANYASCSYTWSQGGFGAWSSSCSNNATRTQTVTCRRDLDGAVVADGNCTAARPASSQTSGQYASCGYAAGGAVSGWSGWSSGCSASATRTRQYQCVRSNDGGQIVPDGECLGRQVNLTESQTGANYASCSYVLEDAGVGACNGTTKPHYWICRRQQTGESVDTNAYCGRSNPTQESCSYTYTLGDAGVGACQTNNQAPHYWSCRRNETGEMVDAGQFCGRSNPTYEACQYPFTYTLRDAGVGACNGVNKPHYWSCTRDQTGEGVDSGTYCGRSNPTYESCADTYSLRDAGLGACQTNNQAPHYWSCIRDRTGEGVDSATYCGRSNPTYEACTYPWTYRLEDAGVGACNGTNRPHYWGCIREQDGARVDTASFCGRTNPTYEACGFTYTLGDAGVGACQTNNQAPHYWNCRRNETGEMVDSGTYCGRGNPTYDSCAYPWGYTPGYGGFTACSGGTQSQTINSCTRSDGTAVDPSLCTNAGHPATRSQSCQSQKICKYGPMENPPSYAGFNLTQISNDGAQLAQSAFSAGSYYVNSQQMGKSYNGFYPGDVGSAWNSPSYNGGRYLTDASPPRREIWLFCQRGGGQSNGGYYCNPMGSRQEVCQ